MFCVRWPLAAGEQEEIRRRAGEPLDWDLFLGWVRRHRVTSLVARNLLRAADGVAPASVLDRLAEEAHRTALRTLSQATETIRIARLLNDAGIRVLMLKGPALSVRAFRDIALRDMWDIDLLVDREQLWTADKLLTDTGHSRTDPRVALTRRQRLASERWIYHFVYRSTSGCRVELHWNLRDTSLFQLEPAALWHRTGVVRIAGQAIATLPDDTLLPYLCLHGASHRWFRLKWLADIRALLHGATSAEIEAHAAAARRFGVERLFHEALMLAHRLLGAPVPTALLDRAERDRDARRLAMTACRALAQYEATPALETWIRFHKFRLGSGPAHWWRELRHVMVQPKDWDALHLPDGLFFLYTPLRPVLWAGRKLRHRFWHAPDHAQDELDVRPRSHR